MRKLLIILSLLGFATLADAGKWSPKGAWEKITASVKRTGMRAAVGEQGKKQGKLRKTLVALGAAAIMFTSSAEVEAQYSRMRGGDVVFYGGMGRSFLPEDTGAYVPYGYEQYRRFGDIFDQPTNIVDPTNLIVFGLGWRPLHNSTLELKAFNYHSSHEKGLGYESGIDEWFSDNESDLNLVAALTHQVVGFGGNGIVGPSNYAPLSIHLGPSLNYFGVYNAIDGNVVGYGQAWQGKFGLTWQVDFDLAHFWNNRSSLGLSYVGSYAGEGAHLHFVCMNFCTAIIDWP